jgi:hypothetical protein
MRAGEDIRDSRRCTACGREAHRNIIEKVETRTYFGLRALDMDDPKTSKGKILNGFLVVTAYVCSTCGHIDLYSSRAGEKKQ